MKLQIILFCILHHAARLHSLLFSAARLCILHRINNSGMKLRMNYSHADVRHTVNALWASYGHIPPLVKTIKKNGGSHKVSSRLSRTLPPFSRIPTLFTPTSAHFFFPSSSLVKRSRFHSSHTFSSLFILSCHLDYMHVEQGASVWKRQHRDKDK